MSALTPFNAYESHPVVHHRMPNGSCVAEQTAEPAVLRDFAGGSG